jgi:hypothetical protein
MAHIPRFHVEWVFGISLAVCNYYPYFLSLPLSALPVPFCSKAKGRQYFINVSAIVGTN